MAGLGRLEGGTSSLPNVSGILSKNLWALLLLLPRRATALDSEQRPEAALAQQADHQHRGSDRLNEWKVQLTYSDLWLSCKRTFSYVLSQQLSLNQIKLKKETDEKICGGFLLCNM